MISLIYAKDFISRNVCFVYIVDDEEAAAASPTAKEKKSCKEPGGPRSKSCHNYIWNFHFPA